jgi:hypothetical protein
MRRETYESEEDGHCCMHSAIQQQQS